MDDYFKEMELALLRSNFHEDREATMARFLHGLNPEIQDIVELHPYVELDDLVQKAMKVEQQLKRKKSKYSSNPTSRYPSNPSTSSSSSKNWNNKSKKEGEGLAQPQDIKGVTKFNEKPRDSNQRARDIKCFRCLGHGHMAANCPTKRTIIVRNGVIESDSSGEEDQRRDDSDEGEVMPEGDVLMIRRLLGTQVKEHEESQRENIFHSRCLVQGNVCTLIIDGGSCANVVSTRVVSKLNLGTKIHPTPYKLQWLSEVGEMIVDQQVEIPFSIGKYEDVALCDVVDMEASHLLLGRPWQYDRKVIHDGYSNKYTFMHNSHKVVLAPLSPKQVCHDQNRFREKVEKERKDAQKKEGVAPQVKMKKKLKKKAKKKR